MNDKNKYGSLVAVYPNGDTIVLDHDKPFALLQAKKKELIEEYRLRKIELKLKYSFNVK